MSGRYLLDTNILIALFANETTVQEKLAQADEVYIPSIVIGELLWSMEIAADARESHSH